MSRRITIVVQAAGEPLWSRNLAAGQIVKLRASGHDSISAMFAAQAPAWSPGGTPSISDPNVYAYPFRLVQYSGGIGDPTSRRLYVHGGGHASSINPSLFYYDFSADMPLGWQFCANSAPTTSAGVEAIYADAMSSAEKTVYGGFTYPASVHTWDLCWMDGNDFWRTKGSRWLGEGAESFRTWKYTSSGWIEMYTDAVGFQLDAHTIYDPTTRKTLLIRGNQAMMLDLSAGWGPSFTLSQDVGRAGVAVNNLNPAHPNTARPALLRTTAGTFIVSVDWTKGATQNPVNSVTSIGPGDPGYTGYIPTAFYEAATDSYWFIMPLQAEFDTAMPLLIWKRQASSPYTVTQYSLTPVTNAQGDPGQPLYNASNRSVGGTWNSSDGGHYKRFCFVPEWRTVVMCTGDTEVHAFKLP
jgi:hypothetical protein